MQEESTNSLDTFGTFKAFACNKKKSCSATNLDLRTRPGESSDVSGCSKAQYRRDGFGHAANGDVIAGVQKSVRHNELVREQDIGVWVMGLVEWSPCRLQLCAPQKSIC